MPGALLGGIHLHQVRAAADCTCTGSGHAPRNADPGRSPDYERLRRSRAAGCTPSTEHLRRRHSHSHESLLGPGSRRLHREQLVELFRPYDPERAHEHIDKAEMAQLLGWWKPLFIHAPESKELVRRVIREAGFSAQRTHYDVPKPRTSFPVGHLTTGIAYAFPWHRDVWYSAPAQQVNWWLPVLNVRENNAMRFNPDNFDRAVTNTSDEFDYYRINTARLNTAAQTSARTAGAASRAERGSGGRPHLGSARRSGHAVLGLPTARLHSEHFGSRPFQHRLSYGRCGRLTSRSWCSARGRLLHGYFHPGFPPSL